jgi:hypothetical protein
MSASLKWTTWAMATLLVALCVTAAFADPVSPEGRGMEAVARVFAFKYRLCCGGIQVNDTANPPWSQARIITNDATWYIEGRGDKECHYDLTKVTGGGQQATKEERAGFIAFGLLSGEMETKTERPFANDPWIYYTLTVFGLPGAVCQIDNHGKEACLDRLVHEDNRPDAIRRYLRALHYVFDHVCSPTELPLTR